MTTLANSNAPIPREETRVERASASTPVARSFAPHEEVRVERASASSPVGRNFVAPWWANVRVERVASTDGFLLPDDFVRGYHELFETLAVAVSDEELDPQTASTTIKLLTQCMLSGAVPPRMTWHGGDASVLFWSNGRATQFFTIGPDDLSYLLESGGEIVIRNDDLPLDTWDRIFPVEHGVH